MLTSPKIGRISVGVVEIARIRIQDITLGETWHTTSLSGVISRIISVDLSCSSLVTSVEMRISSNETLLQIYPSARATSVVPGIKSIWNTWRTGGRPGRSFGKTSGNSLTTRISSSLFSSDFFSITGYYPKLNNLRDISFDFYTGYEYSQALPWALLLVVFRTNFHNPSLTGHDKELVLLVADYFQRLAFLFLAVLRGEVVNIPSILRKSPDETSIISLESGLYRMVKNSSSSSRPQFRGNNISFFKMRHGIQPRGHGAEVEVDDRLRPRFLSGNNSSGRKNS
ncbi:hypothetical protein Tco_0969967 [Tanacetum coccineum]